MAARLCFLHDGRLGSTRGGQLKPLALFDIALPFFPFDPNTALIPARVNDPLGVSGLDLRYRDRTEERWASLEMTAIRDCLLGGNAGERQRS